MQPKLLGPQGDAEKVFLLGEGKQLRAFAAQVGGISLARRDQQAAAQEELNGFHHGLPAETNAGRNIVGAVYPARQKCFNYLNAVAVFQIRRTGGGTSGVFGHRSHAPCRHKVPTINLYRYSTTDWAKKQVGA